MRNHAVRASAGYIHPAPDIVGTSQFNVGIPTTQAITVPAGTKEGDLIFVFIRSAGGAAVVEPSDTTGWTSYGIYNNTKLWYRQAPASVPASYDFTRTNDVGSMSAVMVVVDGSKDTQFQVTQAPTALSDPPEPATYVYTSANNQYRIFSAVQWNFVATSIVSKDSDLEVLETSDIDGGGGTMVLDAFVDANSEITIDGSITFSGNAADLSYSQLYVYRDPNGPR